MCVFHIIRKASIRFVHFSLPKVCFFAGTNPSKPSRAPKSFCFTLCVLSVICSLL